MPKNDSLLIAPHYSFSDRFVLAVAKFLNWIALLSLVISVSYVLWIGWAFSMQLRVLLDNSGWSILIYIGVMTFVLVLGYINSKLAPRLILGADTFGKLGGLLRHTFAAALRASSQITVELFDHDRPLAVQFNTIQLRILHDTLKAKFVELRPACCAAASLPTVLSCSC